MSDFDWFDWLRVFDAVLSLYCMYALIRRYRDKGKTWNRKTRDYWYALLVWSAAGLSIAIQGVFFDLPITPSLVLLTAASLTAAKGVSTKGSWGGT